VNNEHNRMSNTQISTTRQHTQMQIIEYWNQLRFLVCKLYIKYIAHILDILCLFINTILFYIFIISHYNKRYLLLSITLDV